MSITPNPTNIVQANCLMVTINALVQLRQDFEQNEFARSNASLYEILSGVYSSFTEASVDKAVLKATVLAMKEELTLQGARVQVNTLTLGLFVRYVFRTDRQRAYNYTCTLQAAIASNVAPVDLAAFIAAQGGVEECKKQFAKSEKTIVAEQLVAESMPLVTEFLSAPSQSMLVEFDVPPAFVANTCNEEFTFLIAKADATGHVQVIAAVPAYSKSMTKWAKQELAVFLAGQQQLNQKIELDKRLENAMENALHNAKKNNPTTETVGELLAA